MSLSLTVDIFLTFICFFYYLLWTHFLGRDYRAKYYSYSVPTLREKCPKYIVLSGPYFSAFRLNMDIYSVNHSVMTTMFKLLARVRNTIDVTELTYWTTLKFYEGAKHLKWSLDFMSKIEGRYNTKYTNISQSSFQPVRNFYAQKETPKRKYLYCCMNNNMVSYILFNIFSNIFSIC